jgi:hypothetical protein
MMQPQTLFRLGGFASIAGGSLRLGEPVLRATLAGNALSQCYFAIDVFLLLGLIAWYGWRAEKLGIAGVIGFMSGVIGILVIRSANLFAPQGYVIGATLLLLGLAVMNAPALLRRARPIGPPLLWLIAFALGLGSLAVPPLAVAAGTAFGIGTIFAGVALLRA